MSHLIDAVNITADTTNLNGFFNIFGSPPTETQASLDFLDDYVALYTAGSADYQVDPTNRIIVGIASPASLANPGKIHVRGDGSTSATNALVLENQATTRILEVQDTGDFYIGDVQLNLGTFSVGGVTHRFYGADPEIQLRDTSSTGSVDNATISLQDSAGTEFGVIGFNGSTALQIKNSNAASNISVNSTGGSVSLLVDSGASGAVALDVLGNLVINSAQKADAQGAVALKDAAVVPTTNPAGGGILYSEGGALKWRGSSGTVTTIANA